MNASAYVLEELFQLPLQWALYAPGRGFLDYIDCDRRGCSEVAVVLYPDAALCASCDAELEEASLVERVAALGTTDLAARRERWRGRVRAAYEAGLQLPRSPMLDARLARAARRAVTRLLADLEMDA